MGKNPLHPLWVRIIALGDSEHTGRKSKGNLLLVERTTEGYGRNWWPEQRDPRRSREPAEL